ncbi:nucleotidyltransferase domain-containing protein [Selenomonas ruminantium]|uniref:Predicted nucleotidyltransferase n=1 Tax=Selenomonas ruminantium TaxID=971 RepID=A0A1H0TA38_SELRU|nr:nucleotidyltransferase domain-containing protein [Selenomonas ruminantium]SDP50874.1 Predicted nucleotidyltransferase [Selenomonas ruminantium]
MLTNEIELIKNQLVNSLSPKKIYLFGSFAEGNETEDSDFDFYIIVADGTANLVDLTVEAYKSIRHVRSLAVDIIIGTESSFEGRKMKLGIENEVMNKGVLLYAA